MKKTSGDRRLPELTGDSRETQVLCNNNFVSFQAISDSHSTGTEVLHPRRKRNLERVINLLSSRYGALLPNTLEGDNSNGAKRGAPPAAKLAIEALETFEVGSTSSEEGERMAVLCAVCKDVMVLRTDDPHYERKRAREEQPLIVIDGASSSSISGREENNDHHVAGTRRRTRRKRTPKRYMGH
ncbi:hypothetical protein Bca4012_056294 [Brassica carinata]